MWHNLPAGPPGRSKRGLEKFRWCLHFVTLQGRGLGFEMVDVLDVKKLKLLLGITETERKV